MAFKNAGQREDVANVIIDDEDLRSRKSGNTARLCSDRGKFSCLARLLGGSLTKTLKDLDELVALWLASR